MPLSTAIRETTLSLQDVVGAEGFAERALAVISRVPNAPDSAAVLELLCAARDALGAEQAVFGSFLRDDDSGESFQFLLAARPAWCMAYQQKNWYANDAWLLYATRNSEPVSDTNIPLRTQGQRDARVIAAEHGIVSAFVVPAPASGGRSRLGALILGSARPGHFDSPAAASMKVLARSLAMELHEWWVRQMCREIMTTCGVTDKDLELLRLERRGLSTKEISRELQLTADCIDSRFQRLSAKFNMPNRRATARLAVEYGLIE